MTRTRRKERMKEILHDRLRHREDPSAPVSAVTLLMDEAARVRAIKPGTSFTTRVSWAYHLAACRLLAWGDPASILRFREISKLEN